MKAPFRLISAQERTWRKKKMPPPGGDGSSLLTQVQSFFVLVIGLHPPPDKTLTVC
jgi:hypothetical protein